MTKKLISLLTICLLFTSCLYGCGNEKETNPTTTEAEVTTEKETTTATEVTTQEPTTEEPTTPEETEEYMYMGTKVNIPIEAIDYFNGLILENGDKIYLNDIYSDDSVEYDDDRGSFASALLSKFKMIKEKKALSDKYWTEATNSPIIPYKPIRLLNI